MVRWLLGVVLMFALLGCGGGGGTTPTPTPVTTTVNMSTFKGYFYGTAPAGSQIRFNLTGTDTQGYSWTGSFTAVSDGTTVYETKNVNKTRMLSSLTRSTGVSASAIVTRYFNVLDSTLYKEINSLGTIFTVSSQTVLPDTLNVGDFGTLMSGVSSDGRTTTSTWKLEPDSNGNVKFTISQVEKQSTLVVGLTDNIFYLDSNGNAYKMTIITTTNGVTVTLSGNKI